MVMRPQGKSRVRVLACSRARRAAARVVVGKGNDVRYWQVPMLSMSVIGGKADMARTCQYVR